MKNKSKTYILLVVVLAIWIYLGYTIFSSLDNDTNEMVNNTRAKNYVISIPKVEDTISIKLQKRDPFLDKALIKEKRTKPKIEFKKPQINYDSIWRNVQYVGRIKKQKEILVLRFNGRDKFLKVGDQFNKHHIIFANDEFVKIRYKQKVKKIQILR